MAALLLPSTPLAPAMNDSVPGEVPLSENVQVKVWLAPPRMVTAVAVLVVLTTTPPVTWAVGGLGTGITFSAVASPALVMRRATAKLVPRVVVAGRVNEVSVSRAGACTAMAEPETEGEAMAAAES